MAMRIMVLGVVIGTAWGLAPSVIRGDEVADDVTTAAHVAPADVAASDAFDRVTMVSELMKRRGGEPAAAAQLVQLVRQFSPADAFAAFEDLAVAHERAGQLNLAAEARLMAVQAYPDEPATRDALLWLTRLYASCEVAHRYRPAEQDVNVDADRGAALYAYQLAGSVPSGGAIGSGIKRGDEPALTFARAVAARRAGVPKAAGTLLATLKHAKAGDPWGDCARVEAWLEAGQSGDAPKAVTRCVSTLEPPRLDGVLDEACWADSVTAPLPVSERLAHVDESLRDSGSGSEIAEGERAKPSAAADRQAADVRWATDGEYLYIAVRCPKAPGVAYPRDDRGRTRDAALEEFDRVRLLIDIDRDYATCFELTIDSRGWMREACWGDVAWNPEWFVAAGQTAEEWTAEAAIGLEQLGAKGASTGTAWAIAVERELPAPPAAKSPAPVSIDVEAFDLVIFN
jgi:hypothetical protein